MPRPTTTRSKPRELLLPIPHAIADKVHHALLATAETWAVEAVREANAADYSTALALQELADQLDTLARRDGVLGW